MAFEFAIAEAFTVGKDGYTGNPAAVVFLETDDQIPDEVKQSIANTMNLSETAYIAKAWTASEVLSEDDDTTVVTRTIRWFTPKAEAKLCGHATLASAKAFLATLDPAASSAAPKEIHFRSKFCATLKARFEPEHELITLDFPIDVPKRLEADWVPEFLEALVGGTEVGELVEEVLISPEMINGTVLVKLKVSEGGNAEEVIKSVAPDLPRLKAVDTNNSVFMVIVTVEGGDGGNGSGGVDFFARVFVPWLGINEDPVTGSAYTMLAPFWTRVRNDVIDQNGVGPWLNARQASERGGDVKCRVVGDRVEISGRAKLFCQGRMDI